MKRKTLAILTAGNKVNHIPVCLTAEAMEAPVNLHAGVFEILNMRYERVIIDFGILNPNTLKEFMRCDVRIAVCTISKWNRGALNRIIELFNSNKITDSESVKILFNLVEKKKTINHKHFKYPVVDFPYLEDPFLINTSLFGTLDKISERN